MKYDGRDIVNVLTEENSPIGFIRKFLELDNGNLLIGSSKGLWEYDGKDFNKVNRKYGLEQASGVGDIIWDGNELLISVLGKGVARYNGRHTEFITAEQDDILSNRIDHLMKDSKGNIWMSAKRAGVSKFQGNPLRPVESRDEDSGSRVVNYDADNGLNNEYIMQIAEDKNGNLWMASYGSGLNIFDGEEFRYLDSEGGLTSDNIYSVIADNEGNIWAGTQNGVDKITVNDQGEIQCIINYDKYDGFSGIVSKSMAN
jgi:ligand-binding sensor domain-containing protein